MQIASASFGLAAAKTEDAILTQNKEVKTRFHVAMIISISLFALSSGFQGHITWQYLEDLYEALPAIMNRK